MEIFALFLVLVLFVHFVERQWKNLNLWEFTCVLLAYSVLMLLVAVISFSATPHVVKSIVNGNYNTTIKIVNGVPDTIYTFTLKNWRNETSNRN